jgi:hypothetical protein
MLIGSVGAGFLALTVVCWVCSGANPFVIWWWNQKHHARFYLEYPRSYGAWTAINPLELAVALGLPAAVWAAAGFVTRKAPRVAWATLLVLALLELSGRNLGEVARLWLPFTPPLLVAAGAGIAGAGGRVWAVAFTAWLMGAQALALEAMIQVVYPV